MGCVRLTERHLAHDPPTADELSAAAAAVGEGLGMALGRIPSLGRLAGASRLIGLAGTVSTLASLEQGLAEYDFERVHHFVLTLGAVAGWRRLLASETAAARGRRPGMDPGRQDVIVAGAIVLEQVMDVLGFDECLVSSETSSTGWPTRCDPPHRRRPLVRRRLPPDAAPGDRPGGSRQLGRRVTHRLDHRLLLVAGEEGRQREGQAGGGRRSVTGKSPGP